MRCGIFGHGFTMCEIGKYCNSEELEKINYIIEVK
jgi:hypothetical protein